MIKYKKPAEPHEAATAKKPEIGSMLLRTYMTSLLCLVLCVSMFFGTSYAWFTSEVNNTGNEIYIGVLDVELEKRISNTEWVPLSTVATDGTQPNKLYSNSVHWEPGYTAFETLKVRNEGSLAFSYTLSFTDGKVVNKANEAVSDGKSVTDNFEVWVYNGALTQPDTVTFADVNDTNGWKKVGDSLTDVLAGKAVLSGTMETEGEEDLYTIAVHMKEDIDTSVMGHKISMNVKLIAYQTVTDENARYDQMVATAEELQAAFQKGGTVALAADITAKDVQTLATVPEGTSVELYLNNHTITANLVEKEEASTQLFYVNPGAQLTIYGGEDEKNTVLVDAANSNSRTSAIINNCGGTVVISGGKYQMTYGTYEEGYLIPTIVDNNSTLGKATLIINGGIFGHTRNMFRNYANNNSAVAAIVINGGSFHGAVGDPATIWNQKPSASIQGNAGTVALNGGIFTNMEVCTGFVDANNTHTDISVSNGITLGEWGAAGSEWIATIQPAPVTGE